MNENLPPLESRFLPPPEWQSRTFTNNETGHNIAYSHLPAQNPIGIIIIMPGLSEFGEKYIETALYFQKHNYTVYTIDWAYQGRSTRLEKHRHRRHSDGYENDISDLSQLMNTITDKKLPVFMLAHSMGAHIGLRYLIEYPDVFTAASFSAPMFNVLAFRKVEKIYAAILKLIPSCFLTCYVPGGKDWHFETRKNDGNDIFSSDPVRDTIHNLWSKTNPDLQVGNPTYQWVKETLKSIHYIKQNYSKVKTPLLIGIAEEEKLVDNAEIKNAHTQFKNCKLLNLRGAKHEIMMETDHIRDEFLDATLSHFKKSV